MPAFHKSHPDEEESKSAKVKAAAQPASIESVSLGRASESGDPAVQQLLAELNIADSNGDEDAAAAIRDRVAGLGFAV